jgi:hypothetical protein
MVDRVLLFSNVNGGLVIVYHNSLRTEFGWNTQLVQEASSSRYRMMIPAAHILNWMVEHHNMCFDDYLPS